MHAAVVCAVLLATVTSLFEGIFVFGLTDKPEFWSGADGPWLGGIQASESREPGGGWK